MWRSKVSLLLVLSLLFCSAAPVQAAVAASVPEIIIEPDAGEITQDEINDIVADHPASGSITIYEVQEAPPVLSPALLPYSFTSISHTVTASNAPMGSTFVMSNARGKRTILTQPWSTALQSTTTGVLSPASIGIRTTCTVACPEGEAFGGPDAPYNSRDYFVKWYGSAGTWAAYFIYDINPARQGWVYGTFQEPNRYVFYSVDNRVA